MKQITIYSEKLEQLFKSLKDSLATDDSRPILKWIKVEVENENLTAIALDGYMMSTVKLQAMEATEFGMEKYSFYIKPFYIPKYRAGCEVTFNCDNENYIVVTVKPITKKDTLVYTFYQPTEKYIDWEKVLPETSKELKVSLDAVKLIRLLKGFESKDIKNNMVTLSFVTKEKGTGINPISPVLLEQKTKNGIKKEAILLPIRNLEDE